MPTIVNQIVLIWDGQYIRPGDKDPEDKPIFEHCAAGLCGVYPRYFRETMVHVLKIHDIDWLIVDEAGKPVSLENLPCVTIN